MKSIKHKVKSKVVEYSFKDTRWIENLVLLIACIVILLMSGNLSAAESKQCRFLEGLSPYQQEVAYKSYRAGQPYNLGLTTVAIAWEESKLGAYKVRYNSSNINDQSFGVLHTVAKWKVKGMNAFEAGMWVEEMVSSDSYSIHVGVQDILYWMQVAKGDWKKGIGMYNGGYKGNTSYANRVASHVQELKSCKF